MASSGSTIQSTRRAPHPCGEQRRDQHRRDGERDAPAEEGEAEADARRSRAGTASEGEQHEEADVVEQRRAGEHGERGLARARMGAEQRVARARARSTPSACVSRTTIATNADRHEGGGAEERAAPADAAEQAAEQRADRDAEAERGLVEDDRRAGAAGGGADDGRERGRDEEGVAEAPAGAEADDRLDAAARGPASAANTTMTRGR